MPSHEQPALTVAVVGATGVVGTTMIRVLEERGLPVDELRPMASRGDGRSVSFQGSPIPVIEATPEAFVGVDIALFSAGASISAALAPAAVARGALVIDNSSQWRMRDDVPLLEDADHRRADDAGGADHGDGERWLFVVGHGSLRRSSVGARTR